MITAGIDIGSITAKAALLDNSTLLGAEISFTGYDPVKAGKKVYGDLLDASGVSSGAVNAVVATGYGRNTVEFADKAITEITCHGAGANFIDPEVRFIVDVGGQDSKAIRISEAGKVLDFAMNDKCAAGTGRFLEVMARALEVELEEFGEIFERAESPSKISSVCTVFAESEVISLISKGESRENIIAGIHESVASRISSMARRVGIAEPVMMTGGVAKNPGAVKALQAKLGTVLRVSEYAQLTGAIGAAILAKSIKS